MPTAFENELRAVDCPTLLISNGDSESALIAIGKSISRHVGECIHGGVARGLIGRELLPLIVNQGGVFIGGVDKVSWHGDIMPV